MVIACSRTFVAWLKTTIQTVRSTEGSLHRQPLMKIASQGAILSWTGSPSWHTPDELWRYVTCRHIWMVQWWFGRGPPKYQLRKWRVREMYFFHPDTVHFTLWLERFRRFSLLASLSFSLKGTVLAPLHFRTLHHLTLGFPGDYALTALA